MFHVSCHFGLDARKSGFTRSNAHNAFAKSIPIQDHSESSQSRISSMALKYRGACQGICSQRPLHKNLRPLHDQILARIRSSLAVSYGSEQSKDVLRSGDVCFFIRWEAASASASGSSSKPGTTMRQRFYLVVLWLSNRWLEQGNLVHVLCNTPSIMFFCVLKCNVFAAPMETL